jgi:hypothetical protein
MLDDKANVIHRVYSTNIVFHLGELGIMVCPIKEVFTKQYENKRRL